MSTYPIWDRAAASDLAHFAHAGQTDKAGRDYALHPYRVVLHLCDDPAFKALTHDEQDIAVMVAWLHDVIEDTAVTTSMLQALGCPEEVVWRVWRLTRVPGQSLADYYYAITEDPIAVLVKKADIADNADPKRLSLLDEQTRDRLIKKYAKARAALGLSA